MPASSGLSIRLSRDLSRNLTRHFKACTKYEGVQDMVLTVLKNANLALAFFLELGVLVALGYWGYQTGQGTIARIGLGIGAPALAVVVWALFGAPKSTWHLQGP